MRLADLLPEGGASDRVALASGARSVTYRELARSAAALAADLEEAGLCRGDRIASCLPNSIEAVVLELAAAMAGLAVLGVPVGARAHELTSVLTAGCPAAVAYPEGQWGDEAQAVFGPAVAAGRLRRLPMSAQAAGPPGRSEAVGRGPAGRGDALDPVRLFATSGTTQNPKIVVHTQDEIAWHAREAALALQLGPDDVMLCALPLQGVFGHTSLWTILAAGGVAVLEPAFEAQACARAIARSGATCLFGSDTMLLRLLALPDAKALMGSLRWAGFAAFSGPARDLVDAAGRMLALPVFQVYGSSEAQALTAAWAPGDPPGTRRVAGGRLVDRDIEARVVDPASGRVLPAGETGELHLRGRSLFRAYLGNAQATADALSGGWYRTGDLARLAADRAVVFEGRLADRLRLGGYLVDPREIEEVVSAHPSVREAQVVSAAEPGQRDVAVAFVRLVGAPPAEAELRAWCESRLARHKIPRRFFAVDAFPLARGPNGDKIQRAVLRAWAREGIRDGERT